MAKEDTGMAKEWVSGVVECSQRQMDARMAKEEAGAY